MGPSQEGINMDGWIKLHRKMLDNPIVCKDSDHLAVWVYLLLNATHDEYPALFKGQKIILKPGQLITGRKTISQKLDIDESKTQRIIKSLKSEQQIEQQTSNQNRLITIVNWSEYQRGEQQNEQPVNNGCTTDEQRVNTNKNVKKDKNVKNVKNIYGSFKNVTLTDEEMQKLIYKHGEYLTNELIEFLSNYREDKGYKNKSDYLAIGRWVVDAVEKKDKKSENPFKDRLRKEIEREADTERNRIDNGDDPYRLSRILPEPK